MKTCLALVSFKLMIQASSTALVVHFIADLVVFDLLVGPVYSSHAPIILPTIEGLKAGLIRTCKLDIMYAIFFGQCIYCNWRFSACPWLFFTES